MSTLAVKTNQPFAVDIKFDNSMMHIRLLDGRIISVPLEWFPRLRDAASKQLKKWRLIGKGIGIHWDDLDEDISIPALLET